MRTLLSLVGLYIMHRVLLHLFPAYRVYMQRIDRKLTWVSALLVLYFLVALLRLWYVSR